MARTLPPTSRRREAGLAILLVAILVLVLFGIAALVVDGGHAFDLKAQCQATADAAALAAGEKLPDLTAARAAAMAYGTKNMDPAKHGTVITASNVEFGKWASNVFTPSALATEINAVRVTARRSVSGLNAMDTTFGKSVGSDTVDVSSKAVAVASSGKIWHVCLLQDVTSSFSAELTQAKAADKALLDCFKATVPSTSMFGIVTFTGWSRVVTPMTGISTGYATLSTGVSNIKVCGSSGAPVCSGTDIAAGLTGATTALALTPLGANICKAIVLVSDGQPQPDLQGSHPTSTAAQLKTLATTAANTAWAAGIHVFVVFYDGDNDAAGRAFLQTLTRGDGIFLSTPDPSKIADLLKVICSNFTKLHIVN